MSKLQAALSDNSAIVDTICITYIFFARSNMFLTSINYKNVSDMVLIDVSPFLFIIPIVIRLYKLYLNRIYDFLSVCQFNYIIYICLFRGNRLVRDFLRLEFC